MPKAAIRAIPVALLLFLSGPAGFAASGVDNTSYASVLARHVKGDLVDYRGLKADESLLDRYLQVLERTRPRDLSPQEQFAFYINAYNAWTLKLILSGYPGVKSIKELGSFWRSPWKKKICRINGKVLTLDEIEHEILRPRMKDPRIHAAVNCASKSCPPLRSEPYNGAALDRQLEEQFRAFINDRTRNRLQGTTLYVSKIFDWYEEDFGGDVLGVFLKYANPGLKKRLLRDRARIQVRYLDYDWSLNGS